MISEFKQYSQILRETKNFKDACQAISRLKDILKPSNGISPSIDLVTINELAQSLSSIYAVPFYGESEAQITILRNETDKLVKGMAILRDQVSKQVGRAKFPVVDNNDECTIDEVIATFIEGGAEVRKVELCFRRSDLEATTAKDHRTIEMSLANATQAVLDLFLGRGLLPTSDIERYNIRYEFSDLNSLYEGPSAGLAAAMALTSKIIGMDINAKYAFTGQVRIDGIIERCGNEAIKCRGGVKNCIEKMFAAHVSDAELNDAPIESLKRKVSFSNVIDEVFATNGKTDGGLKRLEEVILFQKKNLAAQWQLMGEPREPLHRKYRHGFFSGIDSIHVHVDGGVAAGLVQGIVTKFDPEDSYQNSAKKSRKPKYPSKLNPVNDSAEGPQRGDEVYKETYSNHTPKINDKEKLDYFSTTLFGSYSNTKRGLKELFEDLFDEEEGIVIEVERVIGKLGEDRPEWSEIAVDDYPIITSADVGFERLATVPIEIHYAFDIPKEGRWQDSTPLSLGRLLQICKELNIQIGGWFLFDKGDKQDKRWAYRSNAFAEADLRLWLVKEQRSKLANRLRELGFQCEVTALIEQTLGVWKTPLERVAEAKSVQELAEWEEKYPNLEQFWVIAPNFLGDTDPEVYRAMVHNLNRGVKYRYFLRSFSDFQRLQRFAEKLQNDMDVRKDIDVREYIAAVLLIRWDLGGEAIDILNNNYFIANPTLPDVDGYRLLPSGNPGSIRGAKLLSIPELKKIETLLKPLTTGGAMINGLRMAVKQRSGERSTSATIIYINLKDVAQRRADLGNEEWEEILHEYDLKVALEVSRADGEVVRGIEDGYLLLFDKPEAAFKCARRLQISIEEYNEALSEERKRFWIPAQRVAVDLGEIYRVIRAYGFDVTGKPVIRCRQILRNTQYGQIYMTDSFVTAMRDRIDGPNKREEFYRCVKQHRLEGVKGICDIWRLDWKDETAKI